MNSTSKVVQTALFSIETQMKVWFNPKVMSRICDLCGKTYLRGNLVPRGIGNRVTRRTTRRQQPNLRSKKAVINGTPMRLKLCASCLKRLKKEGKLNQEVSK